MFTINGTDYTLPAIVLISFIVLFSIQYMFCTRAKKTWQKLLPLLYVAFLITWAVFIVATADGSGFLDFSGVLAVFICIYAAICAVAIGAAWIVYKIRKRVIHK